MEALRMKRLAPHNAVIEAGSICIQGVTVALMPSWPLRGQRFREVRKSGPSSLMATNPLYTLGKLLLLLSPFPHPKEG